MFHFFAKYILPLIAAGMLIFGAWHNVISKEKFSVPKIPPRETPATAPFAQAIAAAGVVEPCTENISIGAALSGIVLEVHCSSEKVGSRVKVGDPLFRIDDRHLQAQLAVQDANIRAKELQLARLQGLPRKEEIPVSQSKVKVAETNLSAAQDQFERGKRLIAASAIGVEDNVMRESKYYAARQLLEQAKSEHDLLMAGAWDRDVLIAQAELNQAKQQRSQIQTEIERSTVRAPIDGHILQVNVRPGEYISATGTRPVMVLGNLDHLQVRVDVDEYDAGRLEIGRDAKAFPRGNTKQAIPLTFLRVEPLVQPKKSLTGDNTERVDTRVLQVIYSVNTVDARLYVGQQMDVFIESDPQTVE